MALGEDAVVPALDYLFHRIEEHCDGRPTLLILDEAWLFLAHPVFMRRCRLAQDSAEGERLPSLATQEVADAAQSPITATIVSACHTKIYLADEEALTPALKKAYQEFGLTRGGDRNLGGRTEEARLLLPVRRLVVGCFASTWIRWCSPSPAWRHRTIKSFSTTLSRSTRPRPLPPKSSDIGGSPGRPISSGARLPSSSPDRKRRECPMKRFKLRWLALAALPLLVGLSLFVGKTGSAQLAVTDAGNLVQTTSTALATARMLQSMLQQLAYMRQSLASIDPRSFSGLENLLIQGQMDYQMLAGDVQSLGFMLGDVNRGFDRLFPKDKNAWHGARYSDYDSYYGQWNAEVTASAKVAARAQSAMAQVEVNNRAVAQSLSNRRRPRRGPAAPTHQPAARGDPRSPWRPGAEHRYSGADHGGHGRLLVRGEAAAPRSQTPPPRRLHRQRPSRGHPHALAVGHPWSSTPLPPR